MRQGYWEAEESGEKKLSEYKRLRGGYWYETGNEAPKRKKGYQRRLNDESIMGLELVYSGTKMTTTYLVLRPLLGASGPRKASVASTFRVVSYIYS